MLHLGQLADSVQGVLANTVYHIFLVGPLSLWAGTRTLLGLFAETLAAFWCLFPYFLSPT